jgi:hypothetical protein
LPHPVYCKRGASDFHREAKRENPTKSVILAVFDNSAGGLNQAFQAILTQPGRKIFLAHRRIAVIGAGVLKLRYAE